MVDNRILKRGLGNSEHTNLPFSEQRLLKTTKATDAKSPASWNIKNKKLCPKIKV